MTRFTKANALSLLAAAVVGWAAVSPALAGPNLVNGGFENGPGFPGWTQFGNFVNDFRECNQPTHVTEGACAGWFGPDNSLTGGILQSIDLKVGSYIIQFDVSYFDGSAPPNSFSAMFDTQTLYAETDKSAGGFTHYSFMVVSASMHSADLVFTFQNNPSFVILDAVSVQAVPEPLILAAFRSQLH